MFPAAPDAGGFVVISQVRPQNDQGSEPEEGHRHRAPTGMPKTVAAFFRGEPEVLGATQIFTGILLISFFFAVIFCKIYVMDIINPLLYSGVLIWAGILFIISGSLSVAASVKPTVGKVTSSLVMNVFSFLAAGSGIVFVAIELIMLPILHSPYYVKGPYCAYYKSDTQCLGAFNFIPLLTGILSFILLLFMLMFCIAISTSVFACRTICRTSFEQETVVIYQIASLNVSDTTRDVPPNSTAVVKS